MRGAPVIVVSGLPRSGTSMLMRMLQAGGVEILTDGVRKADEDNPEGYLELERVKELTRSNDHSWMFSARGKALKVISQLLKELPRELDYQVILVTRDLDEVLASQARMLERRGKFYSSAENRRLRGLFERHLSRVRDWLFRQKNMEVLEVPYNQVVDNPRYWAALLETFLGRELQTEAMTEVVEPALYRNRENRPTRRPD